MIKDLHANMKDYRLYSKRVKGLKGIQSYLIYKVSNDGVNENEEFIADIKKLKDAHDIILMLIKRDKGVK